MAYENDPRKEAGVRALSLIDTITARGNVYGHPLDDHTRAANIIREVFGTRPIQTAEDVQLALICVKLARLGHTPGHDDSWRDIAGYVECRFASIAERERRRSE